MSNKEKINNILLKFFSIIYLLFISFEIIINFNNINVFNIIGIFFSIILIYIIMKNKQINNKIFILLIIISIVARISLFFSDYSKILNDYSFFYYSAESYTLNQPIDNNYIGLFPYLYTYIFLLGNLMKILKIGYNSVILLNLFFEILGLIFFYLLIKKLKKYDIKKSLLLYILNPFNILWIVQCCPVIIVNTMFIIIIYIFTLMKTSKTLKNKIIFSILLGITLSISNSFRPIVIIWIISLIIWFIIKSLKDKKITRIYFIPLIIIISIYILSNSMINIFISKNISMNTPKTKSGWSIYVGSNYEYKGMWNQNDSSYLYSLYEINSNEETHQILLKEGIKRYKNLGSKIITLMIYKSNILGNDIEYYTLNEYITLKDNEVSNISKTIITISLSTYLYFILLSNLKIIINNIKNKKDTHLYIVAIYTLGLFVSTLLVEVSRRYFMPIMIPMIIYATQIFEKEN